MIEVQKSFIFVSIQNISLDFKTYVCAKLGNELMRFFTQSCLVLFSREKKYSSSFKTMKCFKKINQINIDTLINTLTGNSDPGTSQSKTSDIRRL